MAWVAVGSAVVGVASQAYGQSQANKRSRQQTDAMNANAEETRFRPYAVTNSFGSARFTNDQQARGNQDFFAQRNQELQGSGGEALKMTTENGRRGFYDNGQFYNTDATAEFALNQNVKDSIDSSQRVGQGSLKQGEERAAQSPEALAKDRYQRYLDFVRPQQQSDFDKLLGGLALNGQMGYRNGSTGTNPIVESFARGLANSDREQYNSAIIQEQNLTDTLLNRGRQGFSTANGLDGLGSQALSLGSELGGRSASAGTATAGILNQSAALQADAGAKRDANMLGLGRTIFNNEQVQSGIRGFFGPEVRSGNTVGQTYDPNTGATLF